MFLVFEFTCVHIKTVGMLLTGFFSLILVLSMNDYQKSDIENLLHLH